MVVTRILRGLTRSYALGPAAALSPLKERAAFDPAAKNLHFAGRQLAVAHGHGARSGLLQE